MSDIFDGVFGQSLSRLKVKNIDSDSLHEIISEFAPLLTGDVTASRPKKARVEEEINTKAREQYVESIYENECTNTHSLKESPEALRNEEECSVNSSSLDETDVINITNHDAIKIDGPDTTDVAVSHIKTDDTTELDDTASSRMAKSDSFKMTDDGALDLSLHSPRENSVVSLHPATMIRGEQSIEHSTAHSISSVPNHSINSFPKVKPELSFDNKAKSPAEHSNNPANGDIHSSNKILVFPNTLTVSTVDQLNQLKNGLVKVQNGLDNFLLTTNLNVVKLPPAVPVKLEMDRSKIDFSDAASLRMRGIGRYKIYQCEICSQVFDTKYHLNRHMMRSHEGVEPFVCEVCSKAFAQKCDLTRHMNVHLNVKKHYCKVCGKSFKRADYLAKHEKEFCSVFRPHRCDKCGRCYATEEELGEHIVSHQIRLAHKCDKCDDSFQEEADLLEHKKQHKEDKPQACPLCNKKFPEFKDFVVHYKEHSGERPYKCALCDKVFTRNHNLMTHLWIHNKIKNHFCPHCGKTFTYYSNLQVHLRVHTGERPYVCGECHKSFLTSSDLRRHHRTHSGDKPYICKTCKMAFTRKERLMQHRAKEHH